MKKKILYLIALGFVVTFPSYAKAECSAVLQMNRIYDNGTRYFSMKLNGAQAFCIDPGYAASTGNVCKYDNTQTATSQQLKIVNYASGENITSSLSYEEQQEIYINLSRGESLASILKGRDDAISLEASIITEFNSTPEATLGPNASILTCGANQQRMIVLNSDLSCLENVAARTCPGGTMTVSGDSLECSDGKGGKTFYFSNNAGPGNQTNVHRQYGVEKKEVGKYCKLYCQEDGIATLPGGLGEDLRLGSYIVWPTSNSNYIDPKFKKDYYPLKFTGLLNCRLGVMPDKNMPGMAGECEIDPVEQYKEAYDYLNKNKNKSPGANVQRMTMQGLINKFEINEEDIDVANDYCPENAQNCNNGDADRDDKCKSFYQSESCDYGGDCFRELAVKQEAFRNQYPNGCSAYCGTNSTSCMNSCGEASESIEAYNEGLKSAINTCRAYVRNFNLARNILQDMSLCGSFMISEDIYDFNSTAALSFTDKEYKNVGTVTKESSTKSITKNATSVLVPAKKEITSVDALIAETPSVFSGQINKIRMREFEVRADDTYTLATGYKYIDKDDLTYKKSVNTNSNYYSIGKQVIPTSLKNDVDSGYALTINGIRFGSSMSNFGEGSNYTCYQKFVPTTIAETCVVRENGIETGQILDITSCVNGGCTWNGKKYDTYADAIAGECEKNNPDNPNNPPSSEGIYCPAPNDNISISGCLSTGKSYNDCVSLFCDKKYKCKNTAGSYGDMDITSCVQVEVSHGLSIQEAIDACDAKICPYGKTIIYRTIKLENPFPSMNADETVTQSGLTIGEFNNNLRGRYPGYNWNSSKLVSSEIRNNRKTPGTTIYQKKEPMYTFILNGTTIKNIRDYNSKQNEGYLDYKLDCKKGNSRACVSSFVHSSLSGLSDGTCQSVNANNFYECDQ